MEKEVAESAKKTAAPQTDDDIKMAQAIEKASKYVKDVNMTNVMKALERGRKDNVLVDKFLSGDYERLVPVSFRPDKVEEKLDELFDPKKHTHAGIINTERQQALLSVLTTEMVENEVAAKTADFQSLSLSKEQQENVAKGLVNYRKHLNRLLNTSIKKWRECYGVE